MKTTNLPRQFAHSAGALLLASAVGMFISIWAGTGLVHPHEPLFGMSLPDFFLIVSGLELAIGLICLFGKQTTLQVTLVLWLAMNFAAYQAGLWWMGGSAGFKGYLGDMSAAFGISAGTAEMMLKILVLYLLVGSFFSLLWSWIKKESGESQGHTEGRLKTSCSACGGHIQFAAQNLGQIVSCPHCQKTITLCKPDLLKMSCVLCDGHIEFSTHAIGQKMPCPHCAKTITLLDPR
ncbi:MAG TPA: hypothetical protein VGM58_03940 [Verrucomicrobiae bacterium]|jgi:hypothetical protein